MRYVIVCLALTAIAIAIRTAAFAQVNSANGDSITITTKTAVSLGVLFTAATILAAAVGAWAAVHVKVARMEEQMKSIFKRLDRHEEEIKDLRE